MLCDRKKDCSFLSYDHQKHTSPYVFSSKILWFPLFLYWALNCLFVCLSLFFFLHTYMQCKISSSIYKYIFQSSYKLARYHTRLKTYFTTGEAS